MFATYKDMYYSIDNKKLVAKKLNLITFANNNEIKVISRFDSYNKIMLKKRHR